MGVASVLTPSPSNTKNLCCLNTKTLSRHVTAAMIISPSPGVRSMKFRPLPAVPSVSHVNGSITLEKWTLEGLEEFAPPPGPDDVPVPYAVATNRLVLGATQTAPAFGSADAPVPFTVPVGALHAAPFHCLR